MAWPNESSPAWPICMLKESANTAIRAISLSMVSTKPEWRCVPQSKKSQGSSSAAATAAGHSQWRRTKAAMPTGAAAARWASGGHASRVPISPRGLNTRISTSMM